MLSGLFIEIREAMLIISRLFIDIRESESGIDLISRVYERRIVG